MLQYSYLSNKNSSNKYLNCKLLSADKVTQNLICNNNLLKQFSDGVAHIRKH